MINYKKVFSLVLAIQFLNVQVQTSFGADAVSFHHPEIQELTQRAAARLANALRGKRDSFIEAAAYRIYKKSIRGRNHLFDDSDQEVSEPDATASRDAGLVEVAPVDPEVIEEVGLISTLKSKVPEQVDSIDHSRKVSREQKLESSDRILHTLGAKVDLNGHLIALDFESFKANLHELKSIDQSKSLSSSSSVLKIILALLAVFSGVVCIGASIMILVLGGTSVFMLILIAGLLLTEFYAIKGIFSLQLPDRACFGVGRLA